MSATATKADIVDRCKEASAHTRAQIPDSAYVYLLAVYVSGPARIQWEVLHNESMMMTA